MFTHFCHDSCCSTVHWLFCGKSTDDVSKCNFCFPCLVQIFFFGDIILHHARLRMDYTSYAMLSCGITYLAVAISLVFILDKVGRRSLLLCKLSDTILSVNLWDSLYRLLVDGFIGMAASSCVIGVTILKSKNVSLFKMLRTIVCYLVC